MKKRMWITLSRDGASAAGVVTLDGDPCGEAQIAIGDLVVGGEWALGAKPLKALRQAARNAAYVLDYPGTTNNARERQDTHGDVEGARGKLIDYRAKLLSIPA